VLSVRRNRGNIPEKEDRRPVSDLLPGATGLSITAQTILLPPGVCAVDGLRCKTAGGCLGEPFRPATVDVDMCRSSIMAMASLAVPQGVAEPDGGAAGAFCSGAEDTPLQNQNVSGCRGSSTGGVVNALALDVPVNSNGTLPDLANFFGDSNFSAKSLNGDHPALDLPDKGPILSRRRACLLLLSNTRGQGEKSFSLEAGGPPGLLPGPTARSD